MKNSMAYIKSIVCLAAVLSIVFLYQNCAQPLDPSLLEGQVENPSELNPTTTGQLNYTYDIVAQEPITDGSLVVVNVNVVETKSQNITFEYKLNGQTIQGLGQSVSINSIKKGDVLTIIGLEGGDRVEKTVTFNVSDSVTPPVQPPIQPPVGPKNVYIRANSAQVIFTTNTNTSQGNATFSVRLDTTKDTDLSNIEYMWQKKVKTGTNTFVYQTIPNQSTTMYSASATHNDMYVDYRAKAFSTVTGKESAWVDFKVVVDSYEQSLTDKAQKAPRLQSNLPQCEMPYFLRGVLTLSNGNGKGGFQVSRIVCGLVHDSSEVTETTSGFAGLKIYQPSNIQNNESKGANIRVSGDGLKVYNNGVAASHLLALSGFNTSTGTTGSTDYFVYSAPNLGNTHAFQISNVFTVAYATNTTRKTVCPQGTAVVGVQRTLTGRSSRLFHSDRKYYKTDKLHCGKVRKLFL